MPVPAFFFWKEGVSFFSHFMRSIKRFYFFVTFGIELKRDTSCTVSRKKGDQMKKSIILPIILALGVGMVNAQTKAGERIGSKERLAKIKSVTVEDGTLYPLAPKKGASVAFDNGEVTYTVCKGSVCADSADFFNIVTYEWQRLDINDSTWNRYAFSNGTVTFIPGEYRLVAEYKRQKWIISKAMTNLEQRIIQQEWSDDFNNHTVSSVSVNGITFNSLSRCISKTEREVVSGTTTLKPYWSCRFASPSITVGKAKPFVFKPICSDGTDKCGADYIGPTKSFPGDMVKFAVKNTNQDYGWGSVPQCKSMIMDTDFKYDVCDPDHMDSVSAFYVAVFSDQFGAEFGVEGFMYAMNALNTMMVPVNSTSRNDIGEAFLTYMFLAEVSMASEYSVERFLGGEIPYIYKDTTEFADTIYYPLTLRDIDINYAKADHGTVTGPAKAHDGEYLILSIVPEDGYDVKELYSRGMDENNEMKTSYLPPEMGELMPDGKRYAQFIAQKGFEQNIFVEFEKVGQEVTMVKPTNGTYSVTSRGKEHEVSERMFLTNAAGSTISVKATPDAGYAVKTVTCEYESKENGAETVILSKDTVSGLYNCAVPDASVLSEDILDRTKQIKIIVTFAKESKIDIDVTGHGTVIAYIKGSIDSAGNYTKGYCSSNPTETEGKACTALDGDSILIEVEDSEGHPLQQLSCKDGTTTTNCKDSKTFVMKTVDAQIVAVFNALNYALTKTGNHVDDFDLYVGWDSKIPATQAHEFDTVYVRSKDGKHLVSLTSMELSFVYTTVDPSTGVALNYFIMPAKPLEIAAALYSTVNLARKVVGKGTVAISWFGGDPEVLEDKDLARASVNLDVFSFEKSVPAEGYTYDTTMCYYDDGTALPALASGSNVATFKAEEEQDVTCKIIFNPKTYKIAWSQADTNGFVQGVPEKGNTDEKISFKAAPLAGYEVDFVKAYYTEKDSNNKDVSVFLKLSNTYDKKKNTYTYKFTMPARDVSIEAAFKEIKSSSSSAKAKSSSSSAKAKSSSAKAKSSSSKAKAKSSSSSAKAKSSSSKKKTILAVMAQVPQFSLFVNGRTMQIAGARVGSKMEVFDLQGHRVLSGNVDAVNFSVAMPRSGSYLVRIDGQTQNVNIK